MTLQQVADEFDVHLNSVEHWRQCWLRLGLVGLYEGRHSGRPPSLSGQRQRELGQLAREKGGSSGSLLRRWLERGTRAPEPLHGAPLLAPDGFALQALSLELERATR